MENGVLARGGQKGEVRGWEGSRLRKNGKVKGGKKGVWLEVGKREKG